MPHTMQTQAMTCAIGRAHLYPCPTVTPPLYAMRRQAMACAKARRMRVVRRKQMPRCAQMWPQPLPGGRLGLEARATRRWRVADWPEQRAQVRPPMGRPPLHLMTIAHTPPTAKPRRSRMPYWPASEARWCRCGAGCGHGPQTRMQVRTRRQVRRSLRRCAMRTQMRRSPPLIA